ncbi:MAG: undecaprenyl-diphosphate phosphatase, partial [Clostridia bacterium]|nr:undecaprenyl-diphosphate phosphatase [Clostridia bacterium]
ITEWLPVSSTGHLILLEDLLSFQYAADASFMDEFYEMFQVVIQLGAILAVVVLFWHKLWPFSRRADANERKATWQLWGRVLVASIPAAFVGLVVDKILESRTGKDMDGWLYNSVVVAIALIVYGVAFILIEKCRKDRAPLIERVEDITLPTALCIGAFQALSLIPGTSRSGSTILGSMMLGLSRATAAEFSFFMAIPAMAGASAIKALGFVKYVLGSGTAVPAMAYLTLAVGCFVSFGVSLAAIRFLTDFVKRHTFSAFGIYRIALGLLVLVWAFVR